MAFTHLIHDGRPTVVDLIHRITHRAQLTPYERHNLEMAHVPLAVITASLGGHATDFANRQYLSER